MGIDTSHTSITMIVAFILVSPMKEMVCPEYSALDHPTFYPNPEDCGSFYMFSTGTPASMCVTGLTEWNVRMTLESRLPPRSARKEPQTVNWTHLHPRHLPRKARERMNWS